MEELFVIFSLLVVDIINPVLFAGVVFSLGSQRPIINTLGLIVSFGISYFAAGVVIGLLLESFDLSQVSEYYLELIVAILLFAFALFLYKDDEQIREERLQTTSDMSLLGAIFLGLQINIVGLPFAMPYVAAIDQMLVGQFSYLTIIAVLILYNVIYVLPFLGMLIIRWILQEESGPIFEKINQWIHYISAKYIPIIFAIIGFYLVGESLLHLIS